MVTRNQASSIADDLLAQERARSAARASRRYWAFPELDLVAPERRAQVRREAARVVARSWLLHLVALAWVAAYAWAWSHLVPAGDRQSALPVFLLGATVPIPFFYAACARRQVRRIVRWMMTSASNSPASPQ
jgi:hypothetical protein